MPRAKPQKKSLYSVHPGVAMVQKWIADLPTCFMPTRLPILRPQALNDDHFFEIRRCELAASYSAWRMNLSPHLLMLPEISSSPD